MKYVIFSDIQGNLDSMKVFRRGILEFPADKGVCLGDIMNKGINYNDNIVIDMVKEIFFKKCMCIKGNHEEKVEEDEKYKLTEPNLQFLKGLKNYLRLEDLLFFHSSLREPGKRLRTEEDVREEAEYLEANYPDVRVTFFGHAHEAGIFSYDPKKKKVKKIPLKKNVQLETDRKYLINPGGIGLYYGFPNTFMVFDSESNELNFYTLDQLEDMSTRRGIILSFDEEWMRHLTGDQQWSWNSLERETNVVAEINRNGRFNHLLETLRKFNPNGISREKRKQYFERYSLDLALAVDQIVTGEVMRVYSYLDYPLKVREFYLSLKKTS